MHKTQTSFKPAIILAITYALSLMDRKIVAILMEPIKVDMDLSDAQLALMSGLVFALFYGFMGLPIARMTDKRNRVNILAICIGVWSLMTALSGMAVNYVMLLLSRMGVGVGEAGCQPAGQSLIADIYDEKRRGRALAIFTTGASIGSMTAAVLGGILADTVGWRMTLIILGGIGIVFSVFLRFLIKEPPREAKPAGTEQPTSIWRELIYLWGLPLYRYALIGHIACISLSYTLMVWGPALMVRTFEMSLTEVGIIIGVITAVAGIGGALMSGVLSDKLTQKNSAWYGRLPMLFCLGAMPALLGYIFTDSLYVFMISMGGVIVLMSAHTPPTYSTYHRVVPSNHRAMAVALSTLAVNLIGLGLSPVLVGAASDLLADQYQEASLRYGLLVCFFYLPIGAFAYWKVAKGLGSEADEPVGDLEKA